MSWFSHFLTSSIGQKLIMSLTGIFLILFLAVHLAGNLQLLQNDNGVAFNVYAAFMTTNPLIKTSSYLLYTFILLHTLQGIMLARRNREARGAQDYAVKRTKATVTNALLASRMAWLGIIIFVFLLIHLWQFWLQMKLGKVPMVTLPGMDGEVKDLYSLVKEAYADPAFVIFYVVSMAVVGMHLWHGFQSAFQTLGLNHPKYSPLVRSIGKLYSFVVPALFALIPVWMYLQQQ